MTREFLARVARASRVQAMASSPSRTFSAQAKSTKFISVKHRSQHATSVRSPEFLEAVR